MVFGDYLFFCSRLISKLNKKIKIYCFSKTQYEIASFYFEDRVILKQLILLPKFLSESHFGYAFLRRYNKFNPTIIFSEYNKKEELSRHYMGNKKIIDFFKKRISKSNISTDILKFSKKKYFCLYVKNFSLKKNNDIFFQVRQTRDLSKIYKIIRFLNKKKINILILGNNNDHFIKLMPKYIYNLDHIYFFKNLSRNYSISDQAIIAFKSKGYLGSIFWC